MNCYLYFVSVLREGKLDLGFINIAPINSIISTKCTKYIILTKSRKISIPMIDLGKTHTISRVRYKYGGWEDQRKFILLYLGWRERE